VKFKLKDIEANPFRHMDRYPIQRDKVETLKGSIGRTGFWDNLVARKSGKGKAQIAYGHHRLIALNEMFDADHEVDLIIKNFSDEDMIKAMADENMQEFGTSATVEQETVRAVVEAYAGGKIVLKRPEELPVHSVKGWRLAPHFREVKVKDFDFKDVKIKIYNAESIARFLGWMSGDQVSPRVRNALEFLERIEEAGEVTGNEDIEEEFDQMADGLGSNQAKEVGRAYEKIRRGYEEGGKKPREAVKEAVKEAKKIASDMKKGKDREGIREGRQKANKVAARARGDEYLPMVQTFCTDLGKELQGLVSVKDGRLDKLYEIAKYKEDISDLYLDCVTVQLQNLIDRCQAVLDAIKGSSAKLGHRPSSN